MNRLETRLKTLETVNNVGDGEPQPIFLVRTSLDQFGKQIKSDFLMYGEPPLHIPLPPEHDPLEPEDAPVAPYLADYRDEPILMTSGQFRRLLALVSNKTRTIGNVPFSEDEQEQLDALWIEINRNVNANTGAFGNMAHTPRAIPQAGS